LTPIAVPSKPPNEIISVVKARASTTTVRYHRLVRGRYLVSDDTMA
jgi:hypothetical protein